MNQFDIRAWFSRIDSAYTSIVMILCFAVFSFIVGYLAFSTLANLFLKSKRLKSAFMGFENGRGLKRSAAVVVGTSAFEFLCSVNELDKGQFQNLHTYANVVRIFGGTWLVATIFDAWCGLLRDDVRFVSDRARKVLIPFIRKMGVFIIACLGGIMLGSAAGINVVGLAAGLGLGGIAIAFAAKDSVENFFGSVTVVLDMPFGVGDWIKMDKIEGIVEEINLRSSRIRTFDDTIITVPNSQFIKASVENFGRRRSRRHKSNFYIEPTVDISVLTQFCEELQTEIQELPDAKEGSVTCAVKSLSDQGIEVELVVRWDVETYKDELNSRQTSSVLALQKAQNLGIPFVRR